MRKTNGPISTRPSEEAAFELGVLYTTIKTNIESFAAQESNSYSFADVATRVARLLESETLREQLRPSQLVPEMRQVGNGNRRGRWARGAHAAPSPLSGNSFSRRPLSAKARKTISAAQKERWAKFHAEQAGHGVAVGFGKRARKPKRVMSAASRAKISKARKAYWAAKKAAA